MEREQGICSIGMPYLEDCWDVVSTHLGVGGAVDSREFEGREQSTVIVLEVNKATGHK